MFVSQIIDEASEILATTDQSKVFRKLTQAVQILMESGHYFHTNQEVDVCTGWDGQTITLPRGIEVPLAVNVDGSPQYFRGRLFQYHVNKGGMYNPVSWAWDDRGFVSTVMDIRQPSQIVAVAEHPADAGLQIRVVGTDSNNRELHTQDENGNSMDGLVVPIHAQSDFPYGTIQPDGITIATRTAAVTPLTKFTSGATAHKFSAGQKVLLGLASGLMPTGLTNGSSYYAGVVDNYTIQLYQSALDAQNSTNPVSLTSIVGATTNGLTLTDTRAINLLTAINMQAVPSISIASPNEVTFSVGTGSGTWATSLPTPLVANQTYFAQSIDSTNLQVYASLNDANNNTNPVYLSNPPSGGNGLFNVNLRSPMALVTTLTFSIPHYFSTGDTVQAFTAGGTLPLPLISGQNYFVYVIDSYTVTVHTNPADAIAGTNPISFTTQGSGTNSLVKLIPATANIGQTSNITTSGLSINAPTGSGAAVTANVVGSVTGVNITAGGSGYTSVPTIQFSAPPAPPVNSNQQVRTATGYAVVVMGVLNAIVITDGGLGYTGAPTISIIGTNTTAATATASITLSFVSSFSIVSGGSGYTTPPAVTITGAGSGATAIATVANGKVTAVNVVTEGSGYATAPIVSITPSTGVFIQFSSTGTLPSPLVAGTTYIAQPPLNPASGTFTVVDQFFNPVNILSNGTGSFYVQLSRAFGVGFNNQWSGTFNGITTGQLVQFASDYLFPTVSPASTSGYIAKISNTLAKFYSSQGDATANFPIISIKVTSGGIGYSLTPTVSLVGGSGTYTTAPTAVVERTIPTTNGINLISGGSGYTSAPSVSIIGGGYTTQATATCTITNGSVSSITVTNVGAGYTSIPIVLFGTVFNNSTVYSTGAQIYYGNYLFTVTAGGTTASTGYPTPASPQTGSGTATFAYAGIVPSATVNTCYVSSITVNSGTSGYSTLPSVVITPASGDTVGAGATAVAVDNAITVQTLGVGQAYYAVQQSAYAKAYIPASGTGGASLLAPSSTQFLNNGTLVTFQSSSYVSGGTDSGLPSPLTHGTQYQVNLYGNNIYLKDSTGTTAITFVSGGIPTLATGTLTMNHAVSVTPVPSTTISVPNSAYDTGTQLMVRANTGDTLPSALVAEAFSSSTTISDAFTINLTSPLESAQAYYTSPSLTSWKNSSVVTLSNATAYYARYVDPNTISLYDTLDHANAGAATGLISLYSIGSTATSTLFIDSVLAPTLVKSVLHIEKPVTVGYVSLYAFDQGRNTNLTLIGQYHPTETNPKYRRIRIGKNAAWARIIYRAKSPEITSVYDYIPLENTRAILAAIHACDLEDKDFIEQSQKYWQIAISYLHNQNESMEGHAMMPPQINGLTYGDTTDPVIDSDFYGY